jgi:hypothetical protein
MCLPNCRGVLQYALTLLVLHNECGFIGYRENGNFTVATRSRGEANNRVVALQKEIPNNQNNIIYTSSLNIYNITP